MMSLRSKIIQALQARITTNEYTLGIMGEHNRSIYAHGMQNRIDAYKNAINEVERLWSLEAIQTISNNIKMPVKPGDVGYNLYADAEYVIRNTEVSIVRTGVKIKLPEGVWGLIIARSSAIFKHKIHVMGGVIDNGYIGELTVPCVGVEKQVILPAGSSIGQLVLFPCCVFPLHLVDKLPDTERGEDGFGSTGDTGL